MASPRSASHSKGNNVIELCEMVQQLRQELYKAMLQAKDEPMRLGLNSVTLELQFTAGFETKGAAKLKFWVIAEGGLDRSTSRETVHTITLSLSPSFADSDVSPWIYDEPDGSN